MSVIQEFKTFAMRGNVADLAVGVIIGGAFGTIVNSLVGDIVMPVFGVATGSINLSEWALEFGQVKIAYGKFLQATVSFLIIALALFAAVKGMNALKKKEEKKPIAQQEKSDEVKLLTEIRDLLRKQPPI